MAEPLKDEEIIRKAWNWYELESKSCDDVNAFISACMYLLRLERGEEK